MPYRDGMEGNSGDDTHMVLKKLEKRSKALIIAGFSSCKSRSHFTSFFQVETTKVSPLLTMKRRGKDRTNFFPPGNIAFSKNQKNPEDGVYSKPIRFLPIVNDFFVTTIIKMFGDINVG